jgi:glyoxylase-like metal-dependent hydrolase (beta-lactamase superfamily II)
VHFHALKVGPLETNCYVLAADGPDALVIDPGGDAGDVIERLESNGLTPVLLVNTHGHADHIVANAALRKRYPHMKIAIGRADAGCLTNAIKNQSFFIGMMVRGPKADRLLDDGDTVEAGSLKLRVLATPGHSPGGIGLFIDDLGGKPALFCGDTLFAEGVGRCDIPGGDWDRLAESIRTKIFTLPDDTAVYPGHGPKTTVGHEKKHNPFLGEEADEE